ncbi:uncharacterized protein PAC_12776 [Phialocephala subalpina]|uniref:Uncharacterized protein n=1 Tax=Phialocephala subalpina TaxID=576137 RepID=A0A1L7XCW8_9HELO|nr:uncharacterized protein PAC_12776 [Phialocephala subalpina]
MAPRAPVRASLDRGAKHKDASTTKKIVQQSGTTESVTKKTSLPLRTRSSRTNSIKKKTPTPERWIKAASSIRKTSSVKEKSLIKKKSETPEDWEVKADEYENRPASPQQLEHELSSSAPSRRRPNKQIRACWRKSRLRNWC